MCHQKLKYIQLSMHSVTIRCYLWGEVAEWLEGRTYDWKVLGFNPTGGASKLGQVHFPCLLEKALQVIGPINLMSMPKKGVTCD